MILECMDGPLKGETFLFKDDLRTGDAVRLRLPVAPIEADEPIYHPFSQAARDRMTEQQITYLYDGNAGLVESK
jgi:hypothetical protein